MNIQSMHKATSWSVQAGPRGHSLLTAASMTGPVEPWVQKPDGNRLFQLNFRVWSVHRKNLTAHPV